MAPTSEAKLFSFAEERAKRGGVAALGDMRFRRLLGADAWASLPLTVRARFAKRVQGAASVVYRGEVMETRISRLGWLLARLLIPFGAPLPLFGDQLTPAIVTVTEDAEGDGQFWVRQYGRAKGFPQVIHSAKRFAGPTGLEEYVGGGIGVALTLAVEDGALVFGSDHYFFRLGPVRLRLPDWLCPGRMTVRHTDCGDGWFAFSLALHHSLFGTLVSQLAMFRDG